MGPGPGVQVSCCSSYTGCTGDGAECLPQHPHNEGPFPTLGATCEFLNEAFSYQKWKQKQKIDDRDSEEEGPSNQRGPGPRRGGKRGRSQGGQGRWYGVNRDRDEHGSKAELPQNPCVDRCIPSPSVQCAYRPHALRAQDQGTDSQTAPSSPEAALPAARGPEAAFSTQPTPSPGAAPERLWPGCPLQEGQNEEKDVKSQTQSWGFLVTHMWTSGTCFHVLLADPSTGGSVYEEQS